MKSLYNDNLLSLKLDEEIEEKFRTTIGQLKGTHKGNLKTAVEEAMMMWVDAKLEVIERRNRKAMKDIVNLESKLKEEKQNSKSTNK